MRGLLDTLFGRGCGRCSGCCGCNSCGFNSCGCLCDLGSEIMPLPAFGEIVTQTSVSRYMNVPMRIVKLGPSVGVCVAGATCECNCGCGCGCGKCGGCGGSWGCCW